MTCWLRFFSFLRILTWTPKVVPLGLGNLFGLMVGIGGYMGSNWETSEGYKLIGTGTSLGPLSMTCSNPEGPSTLKCTRP